MGTRRADFRGAGSDVDITAVIAFPLQGFRSFEHLGCVDIGRQFSVSRFMAFFDFGYLAEYTGDFRKTFFVSYIGKSGVKILPLFLLAGREGDDGKQPKAKISRVDFSLR